MYDENPPNIILIMADQLGASALNCYGGGVDSTPNLDRLAAEGVRFDRNYDSVPLCGPNRACLLTGRSPVCHGVTQNNLTLEPGVPTYASVLRAFGYRTGGFGKFHQTPMGLPLPESFDALGFDEVGVTEDPRLGPWLDWILREHPEYGDAALSTCWEMPYCDAYGPEGLDIRTRMKEAKARLLPALQKNEPWSLGYRSPLPPELGQNAWITNRAIDFVERQAQDASEKPFLCKVSFVDPHDPYDPPAPYDELFAPEDIPSPIPRVWDADRHRVLEHSRNFCDWKEAVKDPRTPGRVRALYHGSLKYMDDQIGRLLQRLDDLNLRENTIVLFTTDHGEMLGDHDLITKGVKHYDAGIRCPLIVRGPGMLAGQVERRLISTLDFAPTLCDWGQVPDNQRPPFEGLSFDGACREGGHCVERDFVSVEMTDDGNVPSSHTRTVITDDHRRMTWFAGDGSRQLFHLDDDPEEQDDRWPTASPAEQLDFHEHLLKAAAQPFFTHQHRNETTFQGQRVIPNHGFGYTPGGFTGLTCEPKAL